MSLYQVIGLFDSTVEQARLSELQQPFFLKMARHVAQQFLPSDSDTVQDFSDAGWRKWILSESLRRTLLLVNITNNLGCRTQKLNGFFYEPLGDELITNLPVPAPDCLWDAKTADEWSSRHRSLNAEDEIIVSITIGQLKQMIDPTTTAKFSGPYIDFEKLSAFTKLVMASLVVNVPDD
jgi:hypothetical protein